MPLAAYLMLAIVLVYAIPTASAQSDLQRDQSFKRTITKEVEGKFLLSLPKDYAKSKKKNWPLVMFLHGSGERGDDLH